VPACRLDALLHLVAMAWLTRWMVQRMLCGHERVVWTAYLGSADWLAGVVNPADEKRALKEHLLMVVRAWRARAACSWVLAAREDRGSWVPATCASSLEPPARVCLRAPVLLYMLFVASLETSNLWKGHV
jgi:hypothetical protein